jgi:hypothetical protein
MALAEGLRIERIRHRRVGARHAAEQRVVDAAVEVDEAADAERFLPGEAARGHAGDRARRVVGAIRIAALPPGIIRQILDDIVILVGDGRDPAELIGVEVARRQRLGGRIEEAHVDHDVSDGDIFVPSVGTHDVFGVHAEAVEVERHRSRRAHLLEALVIRTVDEADGLGALGDARGLVLGRPRRGTAVSCKLIAVRIVSECGADRAAADAHHRMRLHRPWRGRRLGVSADIGLGDQIAEPVIGEVLHR